MHWLAQGLRKVKFRWNQVSSLQHINFKNLFLILYQFSSVQFSCSVVSNSLWPHESQHARPPCPSPTPRVHSDSRPSSQWCHPTISSSGIPSSSCPQTLPASESFPMSQVFAWAGQSTGVRRGKKSGLVVCFFLLLKKDIKKCLDTCSLFSPVPSLPACYPLSWYAKTPP